MKLITVFIAFCVLSFGLMFTSTVYACSGGATDNIQNLLSRTDYVVKADVVSIDDVGQNAILSADTYLFGGSGPEYLLFVRNDPVIVTRMIEGDPYGACNFLRPELHAGLSAYFFLSRRPDGSYESSTQWWTNDPSYYAFSETDTTITLYSQESDGYVEHNLNEQDFVEFVTTFGSSALTDPDGQSVFPRPALLKIITTEGTPYILPIDSNVPIAATDAWLADLTNTIMGGESTGWNESYFIDTTCPGEGCIQVSPDGINRAQQQGNEVQWFGGSAVGQAFLFSSTGDAIAVWNENQISFYTLGWQKHDQPFTEVTLLNTVTLTGDVNSSPYQAAWSPDGRTFAYSDNDGLWSVDVYNASAEPIHLLDSEDGKIPVALRYSPLGRYLQVEQETTRYILDTLSGDVFPDGLVSPDDQILLAFDTQTDEFAPQICYLAPVRPCEPLIPRLLRITAEEALVFSRYKQVEWRNNYSFIAIICERDTPDNCMVDRIENRNSGGQWYTEGEFWSQGRMFAYLETGNTLAIVQNAFGLSINGETLDLRPFLDGEIAAVEWLPSLFYSAG